MALNLDFSFLTVDVLKKNVLPGFRVSALSLTRESGGEVREIHTFPLTDTAPPPTDTAALGDRNQ